MDELEPRVNETQEVIMEDNKNESLNPSAEIETNDILEILSNQQRRLQLMKKL